MLDKHAILVLFFLFAFDLCSKQATAHVADQTSTHLGSRLAGAITFPPLHICCHKFLQKTLFWQLVRLKTKCHIILAHQKTSAFIINRYQHLSCVHFKSCSRHVKGRNDYLWWYILLHNFFCCKLWIPCNPLFPHANCLQFVTTCSAFLDHMCPQKLLYNYHRND